MKHCPNDECPFVAEHGLRASFEDHVERCLDCGARLQAGEPAATRVQKRREAKLVPFTECEDALSANGLVARCQAEGIPVYLGESWVEPPVPRLPHGVSVYRFQVREADLDAARELLAEPDEELGEEPDFDAPDTELVEELPETCPACGSSAIETRTRKRSGLSRFLMGGEERYRVCTACNEEI